MEGSEAENAGNAKIQEGRGHDMENAMVIKVRDVEFIASFAENSSAQALKELLKDEPLTIDMSDYWWVSWHRIQRWQRRKSMSGLWEARIFRR